MLTLEQLITNRLAELQVSRGELARRLGYQNLGKGARRIEALLAGNIEGLEDQWARLPGALGLTPESVERALKETEQLIREDHERREAAHYAWLRARFKPNVIVLTNQVATSMASAFMLAQFCDIDLDTSKPRSTFIKQAMRELDSRQRRNPRLQGAAIGLVVNFTPDCAVRYSLDGLAEEVFPRAYWTGIGMHLPSGKPISNEALAAVLAGQDSK